MAKLQPYSTRTGEIRKIQVLGKNFDCASCRGKEYIIASSSMFSCGFPFEPYSTEAVISNADSAGNTAAYLIDDKNIIWVYGGESFVRPNLVTCLAYIKMYDNNSYNDVWEVMADI